MNAPAEAPLPRTGWCLTSGHAGHLAPCLGVLEALGITPVIKTVLPPKPWQWTAPWGPAAPSKIIQPPWPDVVVASGRQAIPYARAIRKRSGGRTFVTIIHDPVSNTGQFDLVWTNAHDLKAGPNVISTLTTPHRLKKARLQREAKRFAARLPAFDRPLVGVLLGGTSRAYRFGEEEADKFGRDLADFAERCGFAIALTPSRRTKRGAVNILHRHLAKTQAWIWDGRGENPYFGILGFADRFLVTCDSVNMIGEAAFTGKPIQAYRLPGGREKITRFHDGMLAHGAMRWFDGSCDVWRYEPLDATRTLADEIKRRYASKSLAQAAM